MDQLLYPVLLAGDLVFLFLIFLFVKHGRLSVRYFEVVANLVFTLLFCFVLLVLLILSAAASQHTERIKRLTQQSAMLEQRVRLLEQRLEALEEKAE